MAGEETVQIPASLLEKMQAQIAALSDKVGLKEDEILDPLWPVTLYRRDPLSDVEEHDDLIAYKASWIAERVYDQEALDRAQKEGWSRDVPKCWFASYVQPRPPKAKAEAKK